MKKLIYTVIALMTLTSCQESLEDRSDREAKRYTKKNCPAKIGENTTIDSLVFERATHTMHYYYTLSGKADNPAIKDNADISNMLLEQVKNATTTRIYKEAGYNFTYTYHSAKNKGEVLFERTFTKKDYK